MDDYETCSYCTVEVLDTELTDQPDGARICRACLRDLKGAR